MATKCAPRWNRRWPVVTGRARDQPTDDNRYARAQCGRRWGLTLHGCRGRRHRPARGNDQSTCSAPTTTETGEPERPAARSSTIPGRPETSQLRKCGSVDHHSSAKLGPNCSKIPIPAPYAAGSATREVVHNLPHATRHTPHGTRHTAQHRPIRATAYVERSLAREGRLYRSPSPVAGSDEWFAAGHWPRPFRTRSRAWAHAVSDAQRDKGYRQRLFPVRSSQTCSHTASRMRAAAAARGCCVLCRRSRGAKTHRVSHKYADCDSRCSRQLCDGHRPIE